MYYLIKEMHLPHSLFLMKGDYIKMDHYDLNQLALITGFTTRTLRNHINMGLLNGEKINGKWVFTSEEVDVFMAQVFVKQAAISKRNTQVFDFLADTSKKSNRICTVLDYVVDSDEAIEISQFYQNIINESACDIEFKYMYDKGIARVILSGSEDQVIDIMKKYYN